MTDITLRFKRAVKGCIIKSRVLRLARHMSEPSVTVLRYHSVQESPEKNQALINTSIVHSLSVFSRQMEHIARRFTPISLDHMLLALEEKNPFPKNAVAVTFDDGFADNLEVAGPVLKRYAIPATFYVTVNSIVTRDLPWFCRIRHAFVKTRKKSWFDPHQGTDRSMASPEEKHAVFRVVANRCAALSHYEQQKLVKVIEDDFDVESPSAPHLMMNWDQVRNLHKDGHIIGSHTMSHPNLAHIDDDQQQLELVKSKQILERELGVRCHHFSYPHPTLNPHWTDQTIARTKQAGYKMATTTSYGTVRRGDDPLAIKRMAVPKNMVDFSYNLECASFRK